MRDFARLLLRFGPLLTVFAASQAAADPVPVPSMSGPLSANPAPAKFDAGPLGNIYVTGAATGIAQWQDHVFAGDDKSLADITNGQVFVQKDRRSGAVFHRGRRSIHCRISAHPM